HPRSKSDSEGPTRSASMRSRVPASTSRRENTAESVWNVNGRPRRTTVNSRTRWAAEGFRAKYCSAKGETKGRALFRVPGLGWVAAVRLRPAGAHQETCDLEVLRAVHVVPVLELPLRPEDHLFDVVRVVRPDRAELFDPPLRLVDQPREALSDLLALPEGRA